ncbi:tetratricopeptide repeat protein [Myxococcus stipitatus]|uniref:tetratricopeptide repeat protein n=1 Tax=Myxococcus stipitatus TaxID=83455 RepID=UPI0030CACF2A
MLPLLLSLLVAAGTTAVPEASSANLKKTAAFQDWRRGRFLVEEQWVDLPETGLRVGYFVVPSPWTLDRAEGPFFHDAFFVVDARTGQPVAPALVRTSLPLNGCPAMGEVTRLLPEPESKTSAAIHFGKDTQRCLVRLQRKQEAWAASFFPDEGRTADESFPATAAALKKALKAKAGGGGDLNWAYLPNSRWLLAASKDACTLWVIDSIDSKVNETASEAVTRKICECLGEIFPSDETKLSELPRTADTLSWTAGGTALPTCECTFARGGEVDVTCSAYAGRQYSVAQLEEMSEEGWRRESSADQDLKALEDLHRIRKDLQTLNEAALAQWSAGQKQEALSAWTTAYRTWLADGRQVAGEPLNWPHRWYVQSDILRPQVDEQRDAVIDLWAEFLNNLGFALWSNKEWHQAQAAFDDCLTLLTETKHERNVLHLNRGDLFRDMGKAPEAIKAYQLFLSGKVTAAQRKSVERELRKLEQRTK